MKLWALVLLVPIALAQSGGTVENKAPEVVALSVAPGGSYAPGDVVSLLGTVRDANQASDILSISLERDAGDLANMAVNHPLPTTPGAGDSVWDPDPDDASLSYRFKITVTETSSWRILVQDENGSGSSAWLQVVVSDPAGGGTGGSGTGGGGGGSNGDPGSDTGPAAPPADEGLHSITATGEDSDADLDGVPDQDEITWGTDPADPDSYPDLDLSQTITMGDDGTSIRWQPVVGVVYDVWGMQDGEWHLIATVEDPSFPIPESVDALKVSYRAPGRDPYAPGTVPGWKADIALGIGQDANGHRVQELVDAMPGGPGMGALGLLVIAVVAAASRSWLPPLRRLAQTQAALRVRRRAAAMWQRRPGRGR